MRLLTSYLGEKKSKQIVEMMTQHAFRCLNVGETLSRVADLWLKRQAEPAQTTVAMIESEEKSADDIAEKIFEELAKSEIPPKLRDEIMTFVELLDKAAGAAKRSAKNMSLLIDYSLPQKYGDLVMDSCEIIKNIFEEMVKTLKNLNDVDFVREQDRLISDLENKMDKIYLELKKGYFEIEKAFQSAAALIILDHVVRDLEGSTDLAEDAADLLLNIVLQTS